MSFLDQVVSYQGQIREKPESEAQCMEYLRSYVSEPVCCRPVFLNIDLYGMSCRLAQSRQLWLPTRWLARGSVESTLQNSGFCQFLTRFDNLPCFLFRQVLELDSQKGSIKSNSLKFMILTPQKLLHDSYESNHLTPKELWSRLSYSKDSTFIT